MLNHKSFKLAVSSFALLLLSASAQAGVILSVDSVVENTMGELNCCGDNLVDMLNQEGLSSNYTSGTTDFDTFVNSGVTHGSSDGLSWLSASRVFSGYLIFDLGAEYNVQNFVMWNGASGISASVNGFSLSTSLTSDFATSVATGNFTGQRNDYSATVYDMSDSIARYVRFDIAGNFGNGCCVAIGEIAFDVSAAAAQVPEPGSLALVGLGLTGLAFVRRKVLG